MTTELLPCPFCDSGRAIFIAAENDQDFPVICCDWCNARVSGMYPADVIANWNHRARPAPSADAMALAREILGAGHSFRIDDAAALLEMFRQQIWAAAMAAQKQWFLELLKEKREAESKDAEEGRAIAGINSPGFNQPLGAMDMCSNLIEIIEEEDFAALTPLERKEG